MATANSADELNLQNLKVEESTTPKPETPEGPKQEKLKQEKAQAVAEAPAEELDFNRTPEEVEKALGQWSTKPTTYNKPNPNEKL